LLFLSPGLCFTEYSVEAEEAIVCSSYTCKLSTQEFTSETCVYYDPSGNGTYYATNCTNVAYPYCPESAGKNSSCAIKPNPTNAAKWPGEKCVSNDDCSTYATKGCIEGICRGSGVGESCTSQNNCDPGYHCANSTCVLQLEIGEKGCSEDGDCVNSAGCDIATNAKPGTGVCVKYLSVEEYHRVQSCDPTYFNNSLCASYLCGTQCYMSYCLPRLPSLNQPPVACSSDSDCPSVTDPQYEMPLYSQCKCGYNPEGKAYCGLFPGDTIYGKFLDKLSDYLASSALLYCNTERRFNPVCMKDWWGAKNMAIYSYYDTLIKDYPDIQNNQDCVAEIFNTKYISISQQYEYYLDNFGNVLTLIAGVVFACLIN